MAAKHATTTIPIVIGRVADPVGSGLVASLARPGGNITGWTHQGIELRVKRLELLKEAVPEATRVGVLWNPANPIHGPWLKSMEATAEALKVQLHPVDARRPQDIEGAFATLARKRVQALIVYSRIGDVPGSGTASHRPRCAKPNPDDATGSGTL